MLTSEMIDYLNKTQASSSEMIRVAAGFPIEKVGTWLSAVIRSSLDGVIVLNHDGDIVLINREAERMFGYASARLLGQAFDNLVPTEARAEQRKQMKSFASSQMTGRRLRIKLDLTCLHATGDEFLVSAAISRISIGDEAFLAILLRELVDRPNKSPQALAQATLRKLALSSQQATENEKRRFSKELYDDLGQRLSVLKLDLDWLESADPADPTVHARIAQMQGLLDNIISRTKNIATTLRPSILDDFGLLPAVEWMLESFEKKTGIPTSLSNDGVPTKPGDQVESAIFRILQESLLNIERHARAQSVVVHLWHTEQSMHLSVQDDGVGLQENSRSKPGAYGLKVMQDRIYALGGTLSVNNNQTRGLEIHASIPYHS